MNRSAPDELRPDTSLEESPVAKASPLAAHPWSGAPQRATVRVAEPLAAQEQARLQAALERHFRCPIQIEQELAPEVIGGVWVRVGDTVIDGSLRGRLETLSHHLCARCRVMVSGGMV